MLGTGHPINGLVTPERRTDGVAGECVGHDFV
jgi:hypothetical protein